MRRRGRPGGGGGGSRSRGEMRPAEPRQIGKHQLRELLEFLVVRLVEHRSAVMVKEREKQGRLYYDVKVAKSDMGKLLGRGGKTISSIRTVIRAAANKAGGDAIVDVLEEDE
jgi:uncharacterized protein